MSECRRSSILLLLFDDTEFTAPLKSGTFHFFRPSHPFEAKILHQIAPGEVVLAQRSFIYAAIFNKQVIMTFNEISDEMRFTVAESEKVETNPERVPDLLFSAAIRLGESLYFASGFSNSDKAP